MSRRIDHQRGGIGWVIARGATQQKVVVRPKRGTIRSTGVERNDAGLRNWIEETLHCLRISWIGHQQASVASHNFGRGRVGVASRWVIGDPRDRSVEALGLGIPGRL